MPLVIHLKARQQVIVNGAVIENASGKSCAIAVKNDAAILRSADILTPADAATPASRTYYALQCLYLFPERSETYRPAFSELIESYVRAAPSAAPIAARVCAAFEVGDPYTALKRARDLIEHEGRVLSHVQQQLGQTLRATAGTGQSAGDGGLGPDEAGPADDGEPRGR